jgi:catechol 2,3-dioxygenase-like lactoylglutathione lyase family enzyme
MPPPGNAQFDHLVLGTADLERGKAWLERYLGVTLSDVGVHQRLGTHNRLLSLGPDAYLELIAIDPNGQAPFMRRWFGLDTHDVQERIAQRPRLIGWVARTDAISAVTEKTGGILGSVQPMERGDFKWRITIPEDGHPVEGGLIPALIQWDVPHHPCQRLPEQGCRLEWMEAAHPNPARIHYLLGELGLEKSLGLTPSQPYSGMTMCAYIRTPGGVKTLMS